MSERQPEFSKLRSAIWPIHGSEMKKFLPMAAMMFLILFISTIVRTEKDVLIVTAPGSGPEVLNFLKGWVIFPASVLFVILYAKMSNVLSREPLFYTCLIPFLIFFGLFAFIIYPNKEFLHPDPLVIEALKTNYPRFQWFFPLYGVWSYVIFYTFAELWTNVGTAILFWQFANEITSTDEAKRYYSLFGFLANFSLIAAGSLVKYCSDMEKSAPKGIDGFGSSLTYLMIFVICAGSGIALIYFWMNRNILTDSRYCQVDSGTKKDKKKKPSLSEGFKSIVSSRYLGLIAILVLSYGISINLVEVTWKKQIYLAYPDPVDYAAYMGGFFGWLGAATIILLFSTKGVIRRFGWFAGAIITPLMILTTGLLFFAFVIFSDSLSSYVSFLGTTPILLAVFFGACQNILGKGTKYSLFDPTNNMAYIPLDQDLKVKGKAAVDLIGGRGGKSGGGYIQQILLIFTAGSQLTIAPYLAVCVVIICAIWIWAVFGLSKEYNELITKQEDK